MPYDATVLRVLIASPGDTATEREVLREALHEWNSVHGEQGVMLQPRMWERDATPELGDRPQGVINRQLVDEADMLIGLFWTRLGTPTSEADSGTVEEIERVAAAGKPVLLYFSRRPVDPRSVDHNEYQRLNEARTRFEERGLVNEFETSDELFRRVTVALTRTVRRRTGDGSEGREAIAEQLAARVFGSAGAIIVARVQHFAGANRLVIENEGDIHAENLQIAIEVGPGQRTPTIFLPQEPIRHLPPRASVDFPMALGFGDVSQCDLVFRWSDTLGEHETRQTITL